MMSQVPLWIFEAAVVFFVGLMVGVKGPSRRFILIAVPFIFFVAVAIDPLLIPAFRHDPALLVFVNLVVCLYFLLGWIWGTILAERKKRRG